MDIVDRLLRDRPIFHERGTRRWDALPDTLRAIQKAVQDGNRTLETGCGASTVVFAAQGARHTAIAPHADEHQRVRDYLKEIDIDDSRLVTKLGSSGSVLDMDSSESPTYGEQEGSAYNRHFGCTCDGGPGG